MRQLLLRFRASALLCSDWLRQFRRDVGPGPSHRAPPLADPPGGNAAPATVTAYRLRAWPRLRDEERTACVLRSVSRMSVAPVTHGWFLAHSGLEAAEAETLLLRLVEEGAAERFEFSTSVARQ